MSSVTSSSSWAFGVDPMRSERYSLRQARYDAVGETVGELAQAASRQGRTLKLLDVGIWNGVSMRHIEPRDELGTVEYTGVDLHLYHKLYKPERWSALHEANVMEGLPFLASDQFDVTICEQVLEHLPEIDEAIAALYRVTKPGGILILGVPIFPSGIHLIRKHVVPVWDRLLRRGQKPRGHVQAFSLSSFLKAVHRAGSLTEVESRGFRIVSGGVLRPLENQRWWWQLNCAVGRAVPGLCTEVQVLLRKNVPSEPQRIEAEEPAEAVLQAA